MKEAEKLMAEEEKLRLQGVAEQFQVFAGANKNICFNFKNKILFLLIICR
jgi:hypothetical protein